MTKYCLIIVLLSLFIFGSVAGANQSYKCGNTDSSPDDKVNLADIIYLINYVYLGGEPPVIFEMANVDGSDDTKLNLSDITRLICMIYLHTCEGNCPPIFESMQSECLEGTSMAEGGQMYVDVIDNSLYIFHTNARYQCCLDYAVSFEIDGNSITATESDLGMPCDCICDFNLESVIHLLPPGEYIVSLIDADGYLVGVDTALILSPFGITSFENSSCMGSPVTSLGQENVLYSYDNGTLIMDHTEAVFNCDLVLDVGVIMAGDTIRIFERNMTLHHVKCMCNYHVSAMVSGVASGTWVLEVYQNDWACFGYPDELVDRQVLLIGN